MKKKLDGTKATRTIILLLTITAAIIGIPTVIGIQETTANLSVRPDPIGIAQPLLVNGWVAPAPITSGSATQEVYYDLDVKFTKPDGSTFTIEIDETEQSGTFYFEYAPDQTGTYSVQLFYPGAELYSPSTSPVTTFTVQSTPVQIGVADTPLPDPNQYWTAPVSAQNRLWTQISGPWLQQRYDTAGSDYNPYTTAPNTAHILWSQQNSLGGMVGGELGTLALSGTGSGNPLILFGKVYFTLAQGLTCVDLYTGETLWVKPGARGDASQLVIPIPRTVEFASQAVRPYIWDFASTTTGSAQTATVRAYKRYDAFTGEVNMIVPNALLSPSTFSGIVGWDSLQGIAYIVQRSRPTTTERNPAGFLIKWDSNRPGVTTDWANGIVWNVSAPAGTGNNPPIDPSVPEVVTLLNYHTRNIGFSTETGEILWEYPIDYYGYTAFAVGDGKAFIHEDATRLTRAYDLRTGNLVWTSEPTDYPWGAFMSYTPGVAYGNYYGLYYDGVYAFNTDTGDLSWKFSAGKTSETPYSTWSFYLGPIIADGKVYAGTSEHTPTYPRYRGNRLFAIDATTGEEIWNILGAMAPRAVAYGYLIADNEYDGMTYCFGKGKTATTVTAPNVGVPLGSNVVITGTVTDQSLGAKDTPAIADEYMSEWMEYLYLQQPCPMTLNGVEVKLETFDPNNNFYEIGTVTSDASGMFKLMWEPPVPGEYTIIATFAGSESYFSSYAETAIGVTEASSPAGPIEPEPTEPTEAPLITTEIAIIAVVIVAAVAIVAFWALKKRK